VKIKRPEAKQGKTIATPSTGADSGREPPSFCFKHCVREYSVESCTTEEKSALADTLWQLSQRTWNELHSAHRHGSGCEKIDRTAIRVGIPRAVTEDANIWAFRFYGKAPMLGYRDGRMFHIVWLDRAFKVYDHG